ncbi:MAG: serine/threonine protein kinase [Chlorogloeopsis fritschii C42_A2020_084]|uniref:serine/threonine protein kinase n=1 Tax=Chlorogloeopsis fritschii TaxID=1124 RepID=UPI0019FD5A25|nr:serine/threonine-protein kinase [Chlorogloeopsis fritschii]MBF2009179.1 serine/threonine protein kinase [Chlorogloeopsis fritschii C42_A2020_084]
MNISSYNSTSNPGLLAKRYQLKKIIGRGGMGEVFLAEDTLLGGISVAIKFLSQTFSEGKMQQDFAREARICAALSQQSLHIVRVTDYGVSENGKPFYVMEYLCGKSLKDLIPTPLPIFIAVCRQICLGLQCAHQGINIDGKIYPLIHRDIKPVNILVVPDPILGQLVKILDFGIAKFLTTQTTIGTSKSFHGTLPYCSPEQLDGNELDSRSDIYSLGVMMFEMLTGQKPWQPETDFFGAWYKAHHFQPPLTIADVNPNLKLPEKLNDLIMACLAKSASDRPQNLGEVLKILESLTTDVVEEQLSSPSTPQSSASTPQVGIPASPAFSSSSAVHSELLPMQQACKKLTWPKDKPIQEIVFPQLVDTEQGSVTGLLLMMTLQNISKYTSSMRCNQFIFVTSPHPMLLWVTLLYSREFGPKWLPCYLDMKNSHNHRLVSSLAEHERYPLIFFTLEAPNFCANVLSSYIALDQRQMLKKWVEQSQSLPASSYLQLSKNLLKQQYQQLQSRMLQYVAASGSVPQSMYY